MIDDSNAFDYNDELDEYDDEQANFNQFNTLRDSTLFLVDCSKNMFAKNEDEDDCLFQKCMKAIRKMYQIKIYDNDKEYVGILLFGTEKNNTGDDATDFQYLYELQSLKEPSAERIKELDKFTTDFDLKKFRTDYGHSDKYSLHKVFWYCSNMFSSADKKLGYKRILLFTSNSHPHKENRDFERLAKNKAKDLLDIGIKLDVIPLVNRGAKFDFGEFYADVLMISPDEISQLVDPTDTFEEIMSNVREKVHKKRPYTHLNLSLSADCSISCSVFNLIRECPKPTKIKLDKKNNVETTSVTHRYAPDTGEVLFASDTKLAVDVCDKRVTFEQDEVKLIKRFGQPGMKLLGFKSLSALKPYMYVKPGHFLYPDEKEIEGSTTLFKALLDKCLEKEKFILCEVIVRSNTSPRLAALVPQEEELDDDVKTIQKSPPGFHLVYLPYADDFRQIDRKIEAKPSDESVDLFRNCIKKLKFKYDYSMFRNPALQKLWYQIEAIALDLEQPEEVEDLTLPNVEKLEKRAGEYLKEFAQMYNLTGETFKAKRKTNDTTSGAGGKKAKTEDLDVESEARAGRLEKLTVPVLKEFIKSKNISVSGTKKDDLIKAIKRELKI